MGYFTDLVIIGLSIGMVYALVALGISLIYSGLDIIHFAHGEIYMIGAFVGITLFQKLGLPYVPTLLLAVIITGLIGVLIERVFYRRLTRAGGGYTVAGMGMVIVGFGMPLEIGNLTLPMSYVWIVVTALVLMLVLNLILKRTMIGLAIRAVAHNKDIAYLSGVNVPLMISLIFGVACAMGAAAGVLIGPINYVQVLMGIGILVKAFAAAVVGGFGSLPGAVLGGLLVGVVESLGAGYVSGTYKDVYAFLLLIIVLMVKPSGILGVEAKVKA
jgi:branched-chain amino acid transport system permease protein